MLNKERRNMKQYQPFQGKRMFYFALAAIATLFHACSNRLTRPDPAPAHVETIRVEKGEPPKASQLALLMREMTAFADSTGKRIAAEEELLPYPERFKALPTAEPTPNMVEHRTFDPYAQAWLHQLDRLYTASTAEHAELFNELVQTCAACHTQMCPGPLVRIRKLTIAENE